MYKICKLIADKFIYNLLSKQICRYFTCLVPKCIIII